MIVSTLPKNFTLSHDNELFIGGEWVTPAGSGRLDVISPSTEQLVASVAEADERDMQRAVQAARKAFEEGPWPYSKPSERSETLYAFVQELRKRKADLVAAVTTENGTPISFVQHSFEAALSDLEFYAHLAATFSFEERRERADGGHSMIVHQPAGVVAAITPWNAPLRIALIKVTSALAAGCTVVFKPSPETPLTALIAAEAAEAAGFPPGILNVVPAGREAADALVHNPLVDKVSFTGSTTVGRHIAEVCGRRIARVSLELGGKSAAIVLDDADLQQTVASLAPLSVIQTGQACAALTRILLPRSRYDEFVEAIAATFRQLLVGDPYDPSTQLGPLSMKRQFDRVRGYVEKGKAEGAQIVTGGGRPSRFNKGYYFEPTLFANVNNEMTIAREEIFGPVISAIPYDDVDSAIKIANDTIYGLSGGVFTSDVDRGYALAKRIRTGNFTINGWKIDFTLPFGGFKQSGVDREGGVEGLRAFLEVQTVNLPAARGSQ
jgi:aldehyde dehydrogenase (NAD+)